MILSQTVEYALRAMAYLAVQGSGVSISPIRRIYSCLLSLPYHVTRLCLLHQRLDGAATHPKQAFGATTLADIISEPIFIEEPDK